MCLERGPSCLTVCLYDKMAAFVGMGMVADAMATLIRCLALAPVLFLYVLRIL